MRRCLINSKHIGTELSSILIWTICVTNIHKGPGNITPIFHNNNAVNIFFTKRDEHDNWDNPYNLAPFWFLILPTPTIQNVIVYMSDAFYTM